MVWSRWNNPVNDQHDDDAAPASAADAADAGASSNVEETAPPSSSHSRATAAATAAAAGAAGTNKTVAMTKTTVGLLHQGAVTMPIEVVNDFQSEMESDDDDDEGNAHPPHDRRASAMDRRNLSSNNNKNKNKKRVSFHVDQLFTDHYSLIVPSSTVRFRAGSSASTGGARTSIISQDLVAVTAAAAAVAAAATGSQATTIADDHNNDDDHHDDYANGTLHTASRVIEDASTQIILEERYDTALRKRTILVKRVETSTKGLQLLRVIYTIVCSLWLGIFFAAGVQMLLNLVLDLSILSGQSSLSDDLIIWKAIGIGFGMIQLCFSFAEGLVLGTRFVLDAWGGHYVIRELFFLRRDLVFVDWMFFWFIIGIPLCVLIGTLFAKSQIFWEITGLVWFGSICVIFVLFTVYTIWFEIRGAFNFVKNDMERKNNKKAGTLAATNTGTGTGDVGEEEANLHNDNDGSGGGRPVSRNHHHHTRQTSILDLTAPDTPQSSASFLIVLKTCILMRQARRYSGKMRHRYFAKSLVSSTDQEDLQDNLVRQANIVSHSFSKKIAVFSRLSQSDLLTKTLPLFTKLEEPKKIFSLADAQGTRPFLTKWTWSLERIFCNPNSTRTVAIVDGPGALTRRQVMSTVSCTLLGMTLIALLIISFLTWMEFGVVLILLCTVVLIVVFALYVQQLYKQSRLILSMRAYRKRMKVDVQHGENDDEEIDEMVDDYDDDDKRRFRTKAKRRTFANRHARKYVKGMNTGVYVVSKDYRLTQANPWLCWTMMLLEILLFYVWPVVVLFSISDYVVASLYTVIVLVSGIRHYLNIETVVQETGRMDLTAGKTKTERWANMSRLTTILQSVSTDKVKWVWVALLGLCLAAFFALFLSGVANTDPTSTSTKQFTFLPEEFYYLPSEESVRYPTCTISKTAQQRIEGKKSLCDFAFLSSLAYRTDEVIDEQLEEYYLFDTNVNNVTDEREYVSAWLNATDRASIPVVFHLFRFVSPTQTLGVVSIRGTARPWDWLADNQLWQAAIIVQVVRAILPIGGLFTPFLGNLVTFINNFQSSLITEVSFYTTITPFVEYVKNDPTYDFVVLTGHSLGGGIGIISAAQSQTPVVAISGPNAGLSHDSFNPPFSSDALDRYTFNVIPERDMVPRFDDKAQNYQNIRCLAPLNKPQDCHSPLRSFCEMMYNCGSTDRPVPCECVTVFEYPEPMNNGTQSFSELCANSGTPELGWK